MNTPRLSDEYDPFEDPENPEEEIEEPNFVFFDEDDETNQNGPVL